MPFVKKVLKCCNIKCMYIYLCRDEDSNKKNEDRAGDKTEEV